MDFLAKESENKVLLIARVSDPEQKKALPAQKKRLYDYAESKGWVEDKDFEYLEFDETAFKGDIRFKFEQKVIRRIKETTGVVTLVFDKTDRFSRDTSDEHKSYIVRQIKAGHVLLECVHDALFINKHSPATDWFRLDINIALGAYYSRSISDNVRRKFEKKLADGEWPGKAPVGYLNQRVDNDHTTIVPDPDRAPFVIKAFQLRRQGMTIEVITQHLKKEGFTIIGNSGKRKDEYGNSNPLVRPISKSNMGLLLRNPFYFGVMKYNGKLYHHKYEPLLKKETGMKPR